jgi:hypothetical protein
MESQWASVDFRCILQGAHPFLLYLSESEMIPTFTRLQSMTWLAFLSGLLAFPSTRDDQWAGTADDVPWFFAR